MVERDDTALPGASIVELRLAWATALSSHPLGPAERDIVRSRIAKRVEEAGALRRISLANADEPEIVFAPYRGDARTGEGDDR